VTDVYALPIASSIDPARLETLPPTTTAGPTRRVPLPYVGGSAACPWSLGAAKSPPPPATAVSRRGAEADPLGREYLLERPIGEGSTGRVWQGIRRADGTAVAVKILRPEYLPDPTMVARFRREGMAVRELDHPHLVPVDDLIVEDGTVAVVMALVNGDDLRRVMQRGRLDARRSVALLAQVAGALAYVHAAGVLHRDVKPENILVTRRAGRPWALLSDFGLARVAGGRQLTRSTQLLGTPAYLAPELLAGRPYGPAVDVYALGVTAYELLTGRRPFDGEHPLAVMRAHLDDEAPRPTGMPRDLWHLVRSCLAKRPEDRPAAADLAGGLDNLARRRRLLSGAARRAWPKRRLALAAAATLAAVPVAAWLGSPVASEPPAAPVPAMVAPAGSAHVQPSPVPASPSVSATLTVQPPATSAPPSDPAASAPPPTKAVPAVQPLTPAIGPIGAPGGGCLDDKAASAKAGNQVQSWPCNNTAAQVWTVGVGGTLRVVNQCLAARGTAVQITPCDGSAAEQWQQWGGSGLLNVGTGNCLASPGTSPGTMPILQPCTLSAGQRWKLP
jgi:serine/threonine protein kinase, bacterial